MIKFFVPIALLGLLCSSFTRKHNMPEHAPVRTLQARNSLPHIFKKLRKGKPVTIAYLGGSITEAPGYRVQTEAYFKSRYPQAQITTVNAGVGGTGSPLGVFRLKQDVLDYKPDLVFVEFAVNDFNGDSLKICNAIEGVIRQIRAADRTTDICFLYTIFEPMVKEYRAMTMPSSVRYMERIADYYKLPSINLGHDVLAKLDAGKLVFAAEKNSDQGPKVIFTNDRTHPTTAGHSVYTGTIIKAFQEMEKLPGRRMRLPASLYPDNLQHAFMLPPDSFERVGNWRPGSEKSELRSYSTSFPQLIWTDNVSDSLVIRFNGNRIGIGDVIGPSSNTVQMRIDGKLIFRSRFDEYCTYYRRSFFFIDSLKDGPHVLSLRLEKKSIDKLKLLRLGNPGDLSRYERNELYIGNVMIAGKPTR